MVNIEANTIKMKTTGSDIMKLAVELNNLLDELYGRISKMPENTLEWTGTAAQNFVSQINIEKTNYIELKSILYNYGKILMECAEDIEKANQKNKLS